MWWHNVPLLRALGSLLLFLNGCALLYGGLHYVVHQPDLLPLKQVRLVQAPDKVKVDQVEQLIQQQISGNFFTVDIARLRDQLTRVPWVRQVSIRREFPDRLAVQLEEHVAFARWNEEALVNLQGDVFYAQTDAVLPDFIGLPGSSRQLTAEYLYLDQVLSGLDVEIKRLVMSPRHAWKMYLDNGVVIEMGSALARERLERFVRYYRQAAQAMQRAEVVPVVIDLRYRNGFAVKQLNQQG